jgi:hypothetical protein
MNLITATLPIMRRKSFTLLLICNSILMFAARTQSATYYVDSVGGHDSNNGTSISTPWQTIQKVNSSKFSPGDQILFNSGDTWREQLNITSSGSAGNPIVFGSYGSGSTPVISGANLATGWTSSTSLNITVWSVSGSPTNQVFEDGARLTPSASLSVMNPGSFYYDITGGRVYVRSLTDDNPSIHAMEISQRNYAIYEAGGSNYITLTSIQATESNNEDIYFNASTFIIASNMVMTNAFSEGLRFDDVANSTIISSIAAYNGSDGFGADDSPNLVIDSCVAHDNAALANIDYTAGFKINPDYSLSPGAPYAGSTIVTIKNSESYNNGIGQPDWRGAGIWADTIGNTLLVEHNLVYGNNTEGIYFDAVSNETAAYNVVFGNGQNGAVDGSGIFINGDSKTISGDSVYGNTIYGNRTAGINVSGSSLPNGCENMTVENNIVASTVSGLNFSATGGCENSAPNGFGNVYIHNAFGPQSSNFVRYGVNFLSTYVGFDAAYGSSTLSVQGDPLFSNPKANGFALQTGSPAIGTGLNLGSALALALAPSSNWPSGVVTLQQNSSGNGWDLGAYVYTIPLTLPAPPTIVKTVVQ